jgi:hypothetical protein
MDWRSVGAFDEAVGRALEEVCFVVLGFAAAALGAWLASWLASW